MTKFNPKIFVFQDLIGKTLYAKHKYNKTWKNFREIGSIIDETKYTIKINTKKGEKPKTYVKNQFIFQCWSIDSNNKRILIQFNGDSIIGTPAERIKKIKKIRRKLH